MRSRKLTVSFDEKKVDAIFADIAQWGLPGLTVGIAVEGRPVYRKGFGLANMEMPLVLSPNTRMRMASVTKHFTCLAYLLLCEEGRAGLDDRLGKYFPEFHAVTHGVTMRQIMGHISGLRDAKSVVYYFNGDRARVSSEQILSIWCDLDDLNFPPGTCWTYTNGGFLILGAAIERITRQSLEEVLRKRIFEPAGMYDTVLHRMDTDPIDNRSVTHNVKASGQFEKIHIDIPSAGEGGVVSTVNDMLRWMAAVDSRRVGTTATWELMTTPQTLANGFSTGYGLGLAAAHYRGAHTVFHSGGWRGGNSYMLKVPDANLDVVIMVNRADVSGASLVYKILDTCLQNLAPIREPPSAAMLTGTFRSPTTGRVIRFFEPSTGDTSYRTRGGQQVVSINGVEAAVAADADGVLRPTDFSTFIRISMTPIGDPASPRAVRLDDFGNVDELVRLESPSQIDTNAIAGQYRHEASGTEIVIRPTRDGARMSSMGRFGTATYDLEAWASDIWYAKDTQTFTFNSILAFDGDGLRYSDFSNRFLRFTRVGGASRR